MENASKALIIAGTTMIGVLILTSMIYLFRAAAKTNEDYEERQLQQQLQLFNSKFEYYNRDYNTIIDMVSLINLAYDTNKENEYDSRRSVRIVIKMEDGYFLVVPEVETDLGKNQVLKESNSTSNYYGDGHIFSVYEYINGNLNDLGFRHLPGNETLSKSKLTKIDGNDTTVYKYLFKCNYSKSKYDDVTGRIKNMEFELYTNTPSTGFWD